MTNFLDWLTAGDLGLAADRLQKQYRLSAEEMQRASESLAPAFLLGLQRLATDVPAWTALMRQFSALGPDRAMPGFDPLGAPALQLTNAFFGSDALSEAVARQASTMSGIAPDIMLKMMPSFSLLTVQAMLRMMNPALANEKALPTDPAGATMAEMLRRSANAVEAFSRPSDEASPSRPGATQPLGMQTLFADALRGGFPWMTWPSPDRTPAPKAAPVNPFDPFGTIAPLLDTFSRGLATTRETTAAMPTPPAGDATGKTAEAPAGGDVFRGMMEAGQAVQAQYAREMLSIFERHSPKGK